MATIVTAIKDSLQTLDDYNPDKNTLSQVMVREYREGSLMSLIRFYSPRTAFFVTNMTEKR